MSGREHWFPAHEPNCVFCGAFGPIEETEQCVSRAQTGRQIEFLIAKLKEIRKLAQETAGLDRFEVLSIIERKPNWSIDVVEELIEPTLRDTGFTDPPSLR